MDGGSYWHVAEGQSITNSNFGMLAALELVALFKACGRQNVALFSVVVMQQCYAAIAIGIVFDTCNSGRYTILATLEVNDAVALFVSTSTVTGGLSAVVVSSTSGVFLGKQRFFGTVGGEFTEVRDGLETSTRTGRLAYANSHDYVSKI